MPRLRSPKPRSATAPNTDTEGIDVPSCAPKSATTHGGRRCIIGVFMERMAAYELKVVEFSVLSLPIER